MALDYNELLNPDGTSEKIRAALDSVYSRTGTGTLSTAMSDTFYGINHRQTPNSVKINKDYFGLTFFTRPLMNMSTSNLRQIRQFTPMLTSQELSIPRAIRAMLDTNSAYSQEGRSVHGSPLIDEFQAFMPLLSNQLISMSGWPDVVVPTFTSAPGAYQEAFSIADGITDNFSTYDITANFRNIEGDPITLLFLTWCHYQSLVFQGKIVPYHNMIIENEIDYQTRIYRLVLDPSRRFVQKIAACGAAFPLNSSIAAAFNFESDAPINRANDQISISFRCMGAMYNDPILISEFNQAVVSQNSDMRGTDGDRERFFVKLGNDLASYFNHKGYPNIDPDTYELSWWVRRDDYNELLEQLLPENNSDN